MVFPHAVHLKTSSGDAFLFKTQLFHYPQASCIARHNIAFNAVEAQNLPGKINNFAYGLCGVSLALMCSTYFIGKITAFHTAEKHIGDTHGADNFIITFAAYPEAELLTFLAGLVFFL